MKKSLSLLLCVILLAYCLCGCTYNPPEGYTKEHHTYGEVLEFAKSIDPDAVVLPEYTDTSAEDWNRNFREWPAVIFGIECHVSSVGSLVWNDGFLAGEFAEQYYAIDTDFDYYLLRQIVSERQPGWEMAYDTISERYNWNDLLHVRTSYTEFRELSDEELEIAWQEMAAVCAEYHSYPVRKAPVFFLAAPGKFYNQATGEYYVKADTTISVSDLSEEGKAEFFQKYRDAWSLLESGLRVE